MDWRLTPANARAALAALRGQVEAAHFTAGKPARINVPLVDLCRTPDGPRERQLLMGDAVTVIDRHQGWAFLQATKDGYCGYVPSRALKPAIPPTHWVAVPATHIYADPRVQARDRACLSMGARLTVTEIGPKFAETALGFIPAVHLRTVGDWFHDPVYVAELFLGTPYLWGGNSHAGLDCSGLIQTAFMACGRGCPADSDLQESIGQSLAPDARLQRGDLLFWKGHVALVVDGARLIHANGHSMSVAYEDIEGCVARILAQGGGSVTTRRRP